MICQFSSSSIDIEVPMWSMLRRKVTNFLFVACKNLFELTKSYIYENPILSYIFLGFRSTSFFPIMFLWMKMNVGYHSAI